MGKVSRCLAIAGLALLLAGCWPVPGQNPDRTAHNPHETEMSPETVGNLSEVWTYTAEEPGSVGNPVVSSGGVHVTVEPCWIETVRPADGSQRWRDTPHQETVCDHGLFEPTIGDPYVVEGDVYVGASLFTPGGAPPRDPFYDLWTSRFDAATGEVSEGTSGGAVEAIRGGAAAAVEGRYNFEADRPEAWMTFGPIDGDLHRIGRPGEASGGVTVGTDGVYIASGRHLSAYDPDGCGENSCPPIWSVDLGVDVAPGGWPVLGDGGSVVYIGTDLHDGGVGAFDAATGARLWSTLVAGQGPVTGAPAVAQGTLFVPTAYGVLAAFDLEECETGGGGCSPTWTAERTERATTAQPAVAGGVVFTASDNGTVQAFDAAGCGDSTCEPLWSASTGSSITGAPAVSNGQLYVGTEDGRLIAYGLP